MPGGWAVAKGVGADLLRAAAPRDREVVCWAAVDDGVLGVLWPRVHAPRRHGDAVDSASAHGAEGTALWLAVDTADEGDIGRGWPIVDEGVLGRGAVVGQQRAAPGELRLSEGRLEERRPGRNACRDRRGAVEGARAWRAWRGWKLRAGRIRQGTGPEDGSEGTHRNIVSMPKFETDAV
jgi:hypothetical protein